MLQANWPRNTGNIYLQMQFGIRSFTFSCTLWRRKYLYVQLSIWPCSCLFLYNIYLYFVLLASPVHFYHIHFEPKFQSIVQSKVQLLQLPNHPWLHTPKSSYWHKLDTNQLETWMVGYCTSTMIHVQTYTDYTKETLVWLTRYERTLCQSQIPQNKSDPQKVNRSLTGLQ